MISRHILSGIILLTAGCALLRTADNPNEFMNVDNLSHEVVESIVKSDRPYVESILGKPHNIHRSDTGETYEYLGEVMQLILGYADNDEVNSLFYTAHPEYVAEMLRLYNEQMDSQKNPHIDNEVEQVNGGES